MLSPAYVIHQGVMNTLTPAEDVVKHLRLIAERHRPEINGCPVERDTRPEDGDQVVCSSCLEMEDPVSWPCPDYEDVAAALGWGWE